MKKYIKDVTHLLNLCEQFVIQVQIQGNESSWTDRKLEQIIEAGNKLANKYNNDGVNKTDNSNDIVTITCYGKTEKRHRDNAIQFYTECASWSEGAEKERYTNILMDLYAGETSVNDL